MYCRKCGKELADGAKFCKYCGAPVTKTATNNSQGTQPSDKQPTPQYGGSYNQNNRQTSYSQQTTQQNTRPQYSSETKGESKKKNTTVIILVIILVILIGVGAGGVGVAWYLGIGPFATEEKEPDYSSNGESVDDSSRDKTDDTKSDDTNNADDKDQSNDKTSVDSISNGKTIDRGDRAIDSEDSDTDEETDDSSDSSDDYVFKKKKKKEISTSDIEDLSNWELQIAINEIYARHGYVFQTNQDMIDYFDSKDWYKPDPDKVDMTKIKFNKTEKKNLEKMAEERDKRKKDGTWS